MSLGPHIAEWSALASELDALACDARAANAVVTDAWGHLWCRGRPLSSDEQESVLELATTIATSARPPLVRGGRIDRAGSGDRIRWYACSFAGVYVLVLLYGRHFSAVNARAAARRALARIEALTIALPPHDGPSRTCGAAKQRA